MDSFQTIQRSLRRSERLLASVVESVEDCIFTTDVDGRLITVNPAGQALLGYPATGLTGLTYLDLLDELDRRRVGPAHLAGGGRGAAVARHREGADAGAARLSRSPLRLVHLRRATPRARHGGRLP